MSVGAAVLVIYAGGVGWLFKKGFIEDFTSQTVKSSNEALRGGSHATLTLPVESLPPRFTSANFFCAGWGF
jgi:hypothetical protein